MIMKKILISVFAAFSALTMQAQPADVFARGADVSWCTEMEADGKRFYLGLGAEGDDEELEGFNLWRLHVAEGYLLATGETDAVDVGAGEG